ncbi:hypothetical protein JCM12681A_73870 [Streptomyces mexicanus]
MRTDQAKDICESLKRRDRRPHGRVNCLQSVDVTKHEPSCIPNPFHTASSPLSPWLKGIVPWAASVSAGRHSETISYAVMRASGAEIIHPLQDEEWGVRRFFVRDPSGRVVNVLGHR